MLPRTTDVAINAATDYLTKFTAGIENDATVLVRRKQPLIIFNTVFIDPLVSHRRPDYLKGITGAATPLYNSFISIRNFATGMAL
jgi:hypothetical protein